MTFASLKMKARKGRSPSNGKSISSSDVFSNLKSSLDLASGNGTKRSMASLLKPVKRVRICEDDEYATKEEGFFIEAHSSPRNLLSSLPRDSLASLQSTKLGHQYQGFCPFATNDFTVPRIPYTSIEAKGFFNRFVKQRRPCVLYFTETDLTTPPNEAVQELVPMLTRWKRNDYLKSVAGHTQVEVEVATPENNFLNFKGQFQRQKIKFKDFLDTFENGQHHYYMTTQPILETKKGPIVLAGDLLLKEGLAEDYPSIPSVLDTLIPYQYNLWMGSCRSPDKEKQLYFTSGLHHDYHENLYILIKGRKKFRLFSPRVAESLCVNGLIKKIHPNGLICYETSRRCDGADEVSVQKWRYDQVRIELAALEVRRQRIEQEIAKLKQLKKMGIKGIKAMASKKKKKKASFLIEGSLNNVLTNIVEFPQNKQQILDEECLSRQQSAQLVQDYIDAAKQRCENITQRLNELAESNLEDKDNNNNTSCSSMPGSLEKLQESLSADQKKCLSIKKQRTQDKLKENQALPDNFSSLTTLKGPNHMKDLCSSDEHFKQIQAKLPVNIESPHQVLEYYMEVDLCANEMLYIPASWFHEVISFHSETEQNHAAFNYWFYPPNAPECTYQDPYEDEYWSKRYKTLLAFAQLPQHFGVQIGMNVLSQFLEKVHEPLALSNELNFLVDDDDDDDDDDDYEDEITDYNDEDDKIIDENDLVVDDDPINNETTAFDSCSDLQESKTTSKQNETNRNNLYNLRSSSSDGSTRSYGPTGKPIKSIRVAYGKHMQLRSKPIYS